jgi:hypothetical protein
MSGETIHGGVKRYTILQERCYVFEEDTSLWKIRDVSYPVFQTYRLGS